jgi:TldD protein
MLKDVAYQIRTPEFWNSMDLIGGPSTYFMGGRLQRRQGAAVAVQRRLARLPAGALPRVNVINTGRQE